MGEHVDPVGATLTDDGVDRPAAPDPDSIVGTDLAHFHIDALLGKGGMGEVYKATDTALDRPVAIKVLPTAIAEDPKLRSRFFREARAQARLHHPNVCHIYYIGEQDGRLFFAMEYIDGESLAERLEREGKLAPDVAVELCRMAASGLREAHAHGFTHRDIKPSNLMIDHNGVVKVVDFGLVKQTADPDEGGASVAESIDATSIVGTPLYMAPEQARGETVDFRADIYALGATLHHLVSGQPPFVGPTPMAVVSKHLTDPRPLIELEKRRRRGPAPIDSLCDRMMAKSAADRFADYDALLDAMARVSSTRTRAAGFWVRGFAFGLDVIAVFLMSLPLQAFVPESLKSAAFFSLALLYTIAAHGRWGQTLGKAALEIEVVSTDNRRRPGLVAAALRALVQLGPMYVATGAFWFAQTVYTGNKALSLLTGILLAISVLAIPIEGALAAWMTPHKRAVWDRISHTMVRYRGTQSDS